MKRLALALLALAVTTAPALADDARYCGELSELALRYLGKFSHGRNIPDMDVAVAVDQCQRGNYAVGIPHLEQKLRANGFTLPAR
ncbi:MAG: hypothetical protein JSR47_23050 [Proteobacteria bacterium]|nr:hypothetical protein [Pseudomonadota bacterium]MBS0549842.1 hypothetical protein [Pseudomonadota bacterium]